MSYRIEKDWATKAGYRAVVLSIMWDCYRTKLEGAEEYIHHYCGYVEVPKCHPLYEVDYFQRVILMKDIRNLIKAEHKDFYILKGDYGVLLSPELFFKVHGGITYSGHGREGYPVESDGWWFGFDCYHSGDRVVDFPPNTTLLNTEKEGKLWTVEEVAQECEKLAEQLKKVEEVRCYEGV